MGTAVLRAPGRRAVYLRRHRVLWLMVASTLFLLLVAYLAVCGYTADRLSRPVRTLPAGTPAQYGLSYENVQFFSAGDHIPLRGWYIDSPGDQAIVLVHGRNGVRDADNLLEKAALLAGHGYDVLMFDLRAHGESGGEHFALGAWETRDVIGALDYLKSRGVTRAGVHGISMGAAAVLLAAPARPDMAAILVESSYADLPTLLDVQLPAASKLPAAFNPGIYLMLRALYGMDVGQARPVDAVRALGNRPILLIHSREDASISVSHAEQLVEAAAGNPHFSAWIVPTGVHVRAFAAHKEEYSRRMLAFYDTYLRAAPAAGRVGAATGQELLTRAASDR
jgi:uncharacterized protein